MRSDGGDRRSSSEFILKGAATAFADGDRGMRGIRKMFLVAPNCGSRGFMFGDAPSRGGAGCRDAGSVLDTRGEILGTVSRKDVLESGLAGAEGVDVEVIPKWTVLSTRHLKDSSGNETCYRRRTLDDI